MAIYYLVPDNERPSWGIGVIYHHVKALVDEGYDAYIMHQNEGFSLNWINLDLPTKYQSTLSSSQLSKKDVIIVPEVLASSEYVIKCKAKKVLFIQAAAYVFRNLSTKHTHIGLGFSKVIIILPHMAPLVQRFITLPYAIIPPMIADYFFDEMPAKKRKKEIIIYPKFEQVDFTIIRHLILKKIGHNKIGKALGINWRLILLQNLGHNEVAKVFRESSIFVSVNLFEALNTSVVEAMACGCIVFCYEGFGPRDYLENGKNAFVFPNNEPYKLIEKLYEVIDNFEEMKDELNVMRENARKTAEKFSYNNMKKALITNIKELIE